MKTFLPIFTIMCLSTIGSILMQQSKDDWSKCPQECRCTWSGGKRTAECEKNGLSEIPSFNHADKIQVLHMSGNPIGNLSQKIFQQKGIINIQKVFLQNCSLQQVHQEAFHSLVLMIELDLSNNNIRSLPDGLFKGNIRIRKLWLKNNPLKNLAGFTFPNIPHLRILDLSNCQLQRLGKNTFMNLNNLEVLRLSGNKFHKMDYTVFLPLNSLKSLTLESNPWHCNCYLQQFWDFIFKQNLFSLPTACAEPQRLSGKTWDKLVSKDLACPPIVSVPEPMVTPSLGSRAVLSCLVSRSPRATITWVRNGLLVRNNSLSQEGGHQKYTLHSEVKKRKIWLNLTIDNVHRTGAGEYTCVAVSQGGMSEANATLVYQESVTYLGENKTSLLMILTSLAVVGMFVVLFCCLIVIVKHKVKDRELAIHRRLEGSGEKLVNYSSIKTADGASDVKLKWEECSVLDTKVAESAESAECKPSSSWDKVDSRIEKLDSAGSSGSSSHTTSCTAEDSGMGSCYSNIIPLENTGSISTTPGQSSNPKPTKLEVDHLDVCSHSPRIQKLCNGVFPTSASLSGLSRENVQKSKLSKKQVPNEIDYSIMEAMWTGKLSSTSQLLLDDGTRSHELNGANFPYHQESRTILACDLTLPRQRLNRPIVRFSKVCHTEQEDQPIYVETNQRMRQGSLSDADFDFMRHEIVSRKQLSNTDLYSLDIPGGRNSILSRQNRERFKRPSIYSDLKGHRMDEVGFPRNFGLPRPACQQSQYPLDAARPARHLPQVNKDGAPRLRIEPQFKYRSLDQDKERGSHEKDPIHDREELLQALVHDQSDTIV